LPSACWRISFFGIETLGVGTFLTAPTALVLVALVALALPAVRASRVDPVRTLREE
jgi:ABC-type lipoprotein release transport system permease subunit